MIAGVVAPFAAIIMGQDAILGERLSGTAAWVLSKPLRRPAFILAKLIAYGLGLLATWVVLPGAIAYFEFGLSAWSTCYVWLTPRRWGWSTSI